MHKALPSLYLSVGDDDSHRLWRGSIAFFETMQANNLDVDFRVTDGDHNWALWKTSIVDALVFVDAHFGPAGGAVRHTLAPLLALVATMELCAPAKALVGPSSDGAALASSMVMVLSRDGTVAGFCSGIVVAQDAILTAAHCVPPGAAIKAHYRDAGAPLLLDVAAVVRNPLYRADAIANPAALDRSRAGASRPAPAGPFPTRDPE